MGLFDMFGKGVQLTPKLAFACSMIYMVASDGEVSVEEQAYLIMKVKDAETVNKAVKYIKGNSFEQFAKDANGVMNDEQKMCLMINLADLLLADGVADKNEQALFARLLDVFGIKEDAVQPYMATLALKNNTGVFDR